jgi:Uma2 family endonuclease
MATVTQPLTLEAFLKLPNIEASPAWEFLDAQAVQKPMPTAHHSLLQKRLTTVIDQADSPYEAFPELRCILSSHSVVPDITVIYRDRLPTTNAPILGAPDWMIEILSPDQSTTKLIAKIQSCLQEGTQLGWLLDSSEQVIMALWPADRIALLRGSDRLPVPFDLPLELTAEQVFSWVQA